jgi:hypothetical protein
MDWSNLSEKTMGEDAIEFQLGFERQHTEMLVVTQNVTNFLKAFRLDTIRKSTSRDNIVVLPRGIEGDHGGFWTLVEVANLPAMDVWRMDLSFMDVVQFEWLGPIGLERDMVGITRPPS